jgi:hypothetical protein
MEDDAPGRKEKMKTRALRADREKISADLV